MMTSAKCQVVLKIFFTFFKVSRFLSMCFKLIAVLCLKKVKGLGVETLSPRERLQGQNKLVGIQLTSTEKATAFTLFQSS